MLTARLRALLRLRTEWVASGALVPGTPECDAFSDGLLLVPEHTWGEDLKTYLPDYVNYEKAGIPARPRRRRHRPGREPRRVRRATPGPTPSTRARRASPTRRSKRSWAEQRAHLDRALAALSPERRAEALAAIAGTRPAATRRRRAAKASRSNSPRRTSVGAYRVRFGDDGALVGLVDADGVEWAGPEHPLAAYRYQTFDERDEARWLREYCRDLDENAFWAVPDQSKPGLAIAETPARDGLLAAGGRPPIGSTTTPARRWCSNSRCPSGRARNGAARATSDSPTGSRRSRGRSRSPSTSRGKDASRLPEAELARVPPAHRAGRVAALKLGTAVDPQSVVRNGNRSLHAVAEVTHTAARRFTLRPLDAALVAVGRARAAALRQRRARPGRRLPRQPAQQRLGHELHDVVRRRPPLPLPPRSST